MSFAGFFSSRTRSLRGSGGRFRFHLGRFALRGGAFWLAALGFRRSSGRGAGFPPPLARFPFGGALSGLPPPPFPRSPARAPPPPPPQPQTPPRLTFRRRLVSLRAIIDNVKPAPLEDEPAAGGNKPLHFL